MDSPVRRPGEHLDLKDTVVRLRVSQAGMEALDALAEREQRTGSDMIRVLLRRGMEHPDSRR
jgi:hypothetical protein